MDRSVLARGSAGAVLLMVGLATGLGSGRGPAGEARADDAKPVASAAAPSSSSSCVLKGSYPLARNTTLFEAASGGRAIASFTGAVSALELSELAADPSSGRARLRTSAGSGSFRLDGYVATSAVPVFTTRDVEVTAGHLWISGAQQVKLVQAAGNTLTAEMAMRATSKQAVRATAPCDAFALQQGTPTAMAVPGNGRGYLTKAASVEFFDKPGGDSLFTLRMAEGTQQFFWSREARAGFVHVLSRADVTIDAWARLKDLEALKKGEMRDQLVPPRKKVESAELAIDKPRVFQAAKEIPVRFRRDEKERAIGVIEVGGEVYVMETVAGWVNVLPKGLWVMPGDEGGFWIPAGEVPKM